MAEINFYIVVFSRDGSVDKAWSDKHKENVNFPNNDEKNMFFQIYPDLKASYETPRPMEMKRFQYCFVCNLVKPERTHHCSRCGKCWLKMEHHCPWVNNCVRQSNQKYFYTFLFYGSGICLIAVPTLIHGFVASFVNVNPFNQVK